MTSKKIPSILKADVKELFAGRNKTYKSEKIKVDRSYLIGITIAFFVFGFLISWALSGNFEGGVFDFLPKTENKSEANFEDAGSLVSDLQESSYTPQTSQEEAVINVVKKATPSVVSIAIYKVVDVYETYYEPSSDNFSNGIFEIQIEVPKQKKIGEKRSKIGGGTGFIVSSDGLVLTNKHVVSDNEAEYVIFTNENKQYQAVVLDKDPFQDLAILKITGNMQANQDGNIIEEKFPVLKLGDSADLQIGQTVITIGNALGEFRNTVSSGVISGLKRNITATSGGVSENLEDVIQTDAAINLGNSGGPLLNLKGEVIGVNVAKAESAQSIGFAIPINRAKRDINQVEKDGKIVYPFLGVRYVLITPEIMEEYDLQVEYGALILEQETAGEPTIIEGSAASQAGLEELDIILKVNGEKITPSNTLANLIQSKYPGDTVILQIQRGDLVFEKTVVLGQKTSD